MPLLQVKGWSRIKYLPTQIQDFNKSRLPTPQRKSFDNCSYLSNRDLYLIKLKPLLNMDPFESYDVIYKLIKIFCWISLVLKNVEIKHLPKLRQLAKWLTVKSAGDWTSVIFYDKKEYKPDLRQLQHTAWLLSFRKMLFVS